MATTTQVIDQIRRRVADFEPIRTFGNQYYNDAIEFALSKLSFDLDASYTTVSTVPVARTFLLVKLATIEMCWIRASKAVEDGNSDAASADEIASITVPDLSVSGPTTSETEKGKHWLNLADRLQAEYDDEISHIGGMSQAAEVQVAFVQRQSLTHGGYANKNMDQGLDAVTVSASVSGSTVSLAWDRLFSPQFMLYEVYRGTVSTMTDEEQIYAVDDNSIVEYDDEDLTAGTYYYRVKTVNPNDLKTDSNTVTAVVS